MPQSLNDREKLILRLRRIRGQLDAVERLLQQKVDSVAVLQQATACRGALDGLIAEIIEDHIRERVIDPKASRGDARSEAAEELIEIVHSFLA